MIISVILSVTLFNSALGESRSDSIVIIQCRDYYAEINLDYGGNCISLKHLPSNIEVLRKPVSKKMFEDDPLLYGMPILFFPNRINRGRFMFEGREYVWPLNDPERNCYVHGELYRTPFRIIKKTRSSVEMEFIATRQQPYLMFPHSFRLRLRYLVNASGLHQQVFMTNESDKNIPFGLAFHTTFNLPFVPGGDVNDIRLSLPVDKEYIRDTITLTPTGESLSAYPHRDELLTGELQPCRNVLSRFFSRDKNGAMRLIDKRSGWTITYTADRYHRFWMLWNGGRSDLLTVEPQTCLIDAFNVDIPYSEKGIIVIKPGSTIKLRTNINVKNME